jgi:hypothetical protein
VANALGYNKAKLCEKAADLVCLRGARLHKALAYPVQRQHRLLLNVLDRYKAHVRSTDSLADGLGVGCIILVGLDVRFDKLRRHQSHGVAHRLELARPVVRTTAGLDADQARRQVDEERGHLVSAQLLLDENFAMHVDPVDLKHVLGQVNTNSRDLHGGCPFRFKWLMTPPLGHAWAAAGRGGGVHPIAYDSQIQRNAGSDCLGLQAVTQ